MDKKPFKPKVPGGDKKKNLKNVGFIALIILIGMVIFAALGQPSDLQDVPYSERAHSQRQRSAAGLKSFSSRSSVPLSR